MAGNMGPLNFLLVILLIVEKSKVGPLCDNWQDPNCLKWPPNRGPKLSCFFLNRRTYNIDFDYEIVEKIVSISGPSAYPRAYV